MTEIKNIKPKFVFLAIITILFFFTLSYVDLYTTYSRGILLLDSLFSGDFPHGYYFEGAFYIFIHIVLAVWFLPVWIFIRMGVLAVDSVICFIWAKLLIFVLAVITVVIIRKLLKNVGVTDTNNDIVFFLWSSPLFFLPCFTTGQYDLILIVSALLAVKMILDDRKLTHKSLLMLSLAVSVKFLFIFPAVLIVLLLEKNIKKLLLDALILMSFSVLFFALSKLFFFLAPETGAVELGGEFATRLFRSVLTGSNIDMSLFFAAFLALCFTAFFMNVSSGYGDILKKICWLVVASYVVFITFVFTNPNWPIIMCLFMIMLISMNSDIKINILLEAIFTFSLLLQQLCYGYECYIAENSTDSMLLRGIEHTHIWEDNCTAAWGIIRTLGLEPYISILPAITTVSIVVLLIVNNPWKKLNIPVLYNEKSGISINTACIIRLAVLYGFFALQMIVSFVI